MNLDEIRIVQNAVFYIFILFRVFANIIPVFNLLKIINVFIFSRLKKSAHFSKKNVQNGWKGFIIMHDIKSQFRRLYFDHKLYKLKSLFTVNLIRLNAITFYNF